MALSWRMLRFIDEYLVDLNAKQAAIRAGYSATSAEVNGPRLLRTAQVRSEVARRQGKLADEAEVNQAWSRDKLKAIVEAEDATHRDKIAAIATMNKLLGLNEPDRLKVEDTSKASDLEVAAKAEQAAKVLKGGA